MYELDGSSPLSSMTRSAGMGGAFHVSVEVYGLEWAFGYAHEGTGVYPCLPGAGVLGRFIERVPLGCTPFSPQRVVEALADLREEYSGMTYDPLLRSCAHFAVDLVRRLRADSTPHWVLELGDAGHALIQRLGREGARRAAEAAMPPPSRRLAPPMWGLVGDSWSRAASGRPGLWVEATDQVWTRAQQFMLEDVVDQDVLHEAPACTLAAPGLSALAPARPAASDPPPLQAPAGRATVQLFRPPVAEVTEAVDSAGDGLGQGWLHRCRTSAARGTRPPNADDAGPRVLTPSGPGGVVRFSRELFSDSAYVMFGTRCLSNDACKIESAALPCAAGCRRGSPSPARELGMDSPASGARVRTHEGLGGTVRFPDAAPLGRY